MYLKIIHCCYIRLSHKSKINIHFDCFANINIEFPFIEDQFLITTLLIKKIANQREYFNITASCE